MTKKLSWFEIALIVVFLCAQLYAAFAPAWDLPNKWFVRDDAFYYFKTAQNISEGHGSTFDGIHPTNGYHPLWMLICIPIFALARFDLILPLRILVIVTGAFQVATAILLYRIIRSALSPPAGALAAVYWTFDSFVLPPLYKNGMESGVALFLLSLLLFFLCRYEGEWQKTEKPARRIVWLGIIATLATLGRLDLVFFSFITGIWIVFRGTPIRYLLPLDILAILVATVLAFLLRLGILPYYSASTSAIIMIAAALIIKIPIFYLYSLYRRPGGMKFSTLVLKAGSAVAFSAITLSAILLGGDALGILPPFSPVIIGIDAVLTFVLAVLIRATIALFQVEPMPDTRPSPRDELKIHARTWAQEGAAYYGVLGGTLAIYMLWNKLAFGSFSPVSGSIKRWWGSLVLSLYGEVAKSPLSFFGINPSNDFNAWEPITGTLSDWGNRAIPGFTSLNNDTLRQQHIILIFVIFALFFLMILLLQKTKTTKAVVKTAMIPLFAGSWVQILSYNLTGYTSLKEWYWLTEQLFLVLLIILVIDICLDLARNRWNLAYPLIWTVVGLISLGMAFVYCRNTYWLMPYKQRHANTAYVQTLPFLESSTQPGAVIGMTGGGNVGYFIHDRVIVNMDGLINSNEYFQNLKNGTGSDYLYNTGMRYVFANPNLLEALPYRGQYTNRLQPVKEWAGKDLLELLPGPATQ